MIDLTVSISALLMAMFPALLYFRNIGIYRRHRHHASGTPQVSVLIPARNEEGAIEEAVRRALACTGVTLEVVVLDDHSTDRTAEIVRGLAREDSRVRLESAPLLPDGWCGKQHACWVLSQLARYELFVFVDADVRLEPDGPVRMAGFLEQSQADLVSGVPRQITGSIAERLLIPLIHYLLLGFLPMDRMRRSRRPEFGAGCGQLFMARREGYRAAGGHAAIRDSLHDGIQLPRAFRSAGRMSDLFDAHDVASCRMYRSAGQVWNGLAKNAHEGLGSPRLIVPASLLLAGGQIAPFVYLALVPFVYPWFSPPAIGIILLAVLLAWAPRFDAAVRFRQSWFGAILHPVGIALLLAIQWYAFVRRLVGRPVGWRGRSYAGSSSAAAS